ncbi:hypothetical protein ACLEQD_19295, partial [Corallococcus sp. 4LFB]
PAVSAWRHLRTYAIAEALPAQPPSALVEPHRPVRLAAGLYVCGDHRENASIDGRSRRGAARRRRCCATWADSPPGRVPRLTAAARSPWPGRNALPPGQHVGRGRKREGGGPAGRAPDSWTCCPQRT